MSGDQVLIPDVVDRCEDVIVDSVRADPVRHIALVDVDALLARNSRYVTLKWFNAKDQRLGWTMFQPIEIPRNVPLWLMIGPTP